MSQFGAGPGICALLGPARKRERSLLFVFPSARPKPLIQGLLGAPQNLPCLGRVGRLYHCLRLAPFNPPEEILVLLFVHFPLRPIKRIDHDSCNSLGGLRLGEPREAIRYVACLQAGIDKRATMSGMGRCGLEGVSEAR